MKNKISVILLAVALILRITIHILERFDYILINEDIYFYSNLFVIIFIVFAIPSIIKDKKIRKWFRNIIICGSVVYILFFFWSKSFDNLILSTTSQFYFKSPNGKNVLLLEERESITDCTVNGFAVVFNFFKYSDRKNSESGISFGEPDTPISSGHYNISWNNNNEVVVKVFSDSQEKTLRVNFK